jgi:hypothetical protein
MITCSEFFFDGSNIFKLFSESSKTLILQVQEIN